MFRGNVAGRHASVRSILASALCLGGLSWGAVLWAGPPPKYELADLKALEQAFVELGDAVRPSVVSIRCYQIHPTGRDEPAQVKLPISQGSGFVIDPAGYIATNHHVIDGADLIAVVLHNGLSYDATLRQSDARSDLAVLKIDAEGLPAVRWGDLADVRVNQWSFACGNPFGMAFDNYGRSSVTYGVVSALGRQMTHRLTPDTTNHYYGNLIETSATINPGNSGGPLFNIAGEVIGVVTAIETSTGVSEGHGFAIPIDRNTQRVLETLKTGEVVRYGFLGIEVNDVEPTTSRRVLDSASARGAQVSKIPTPHCPAARAGLSPRDVIVEFNGVPVDGSDHLVRLVQYTPVGSEVEIVYLRRDVKRRTTVTLGDRSELMATSGQ